MTEFKVGDHVKVVNDKYIEVNNDHTGVIKAISDESTIWPISVKFDDNDEGGDIFSARELELIPADTEPAYVDRELRERMIVEAVKASKFEDTPEIIVARARAFEAYILGDTK